MVDQPTPAPDPEEPTTQPTAEPTSPPTPQGHGASEAPVTKPPRKQQEISRAVNSLLKLVPCIESLPVFKVLLKRHTEQMRQQHRRELRQLRADLTTRHHREQQRLRQLGKKKVASKHAQLAERTRACRARVMTVKKQATQSRATIKKGHAKKLENIQRRAARSHLNGLLIALEFKNIKLTSAERRLLYNLPYDALPPISAALRSASAEDFLLRARLPRRTLPPDVEN